MIIPSFGGWFGRIWNWRKVAPSNIYGNYYLNSTTPIWIDYTDLAKPYEDCPHLNIVINRGAEMFGNGIWKCVSATDENQEFPTDPSLALLNQPNVLQNSKSWLEQYYIYRAIWANTFTYKLSGASYFNAQPKALWHLPSAFMELAPTGNLFDQTEMSGIIKEYRIRWVGSMGTSNTYQRTYEPKDIIYKAYNRMPIKGRSKIEGLIKPISNIVVALQSRNIIMNELGAKGILSSSTKDSEGGIPLGEQERKRIEDSFQKQRNPFSDRSHLIITNAALNYQPIGYPTKDLLFFEEIEEDFSAIIAAYNHDRDIYPSVKGATYENKAQGEKATYQNGIIPVANDLAETMTKELGTDTRGRKNILTYDHLPIMKEDATEEGRGKLFFAQAYQILQNQGIISAEQYANLMEVDLDGGGKPLAPPAAPVVSSLNPANQN